MTTFKNAVAITPHDTTKIAQQIACLCVGVGGTVTVLTSNDQVVQFTAVAGQQIPIQIKRVNSTGTTATNMVGLW